MDDRDVSILWARRIIALGDQAVVLDTETTGLDNAAEIVQIAVIGIDGATLLDTLVKPCAPIPTSAARIHGITDDLVAGAPTFDQVHAQLAELLPGKTVVIYNADYDVRMLDQSCHPYGLPVVPAASWECAMEQYAVYVGEWNDYHGNYRWQRLPGGDHSARGDALATLALIQRMAAAQISTE